LYAAAAAKKQAFQRTKPHIGHVDHGKTTLTAAKAQYLFIHSINGQ